MAMTTKRTQVSGTARRADLVVQELTDLPRSGVRGLFDHGCVSVDGADVEAGTILPLGSALVVHYDSARRYHEKPRVRTSRAFRIVFEDPHLIVIDKAAGVLTVPTERREHFTVVSELARHVSRGRRITQRVFIVHRLDRDTSGLLVFAKDPKTAAQLKDQLALRKPERQYLAFVAGNLPDDQGSVRSYLRTTRDLDQESTDEPGEGKLAVTHYEVAERLGHATVVRVKLETGRRNQIRVHFAEQGHPVLGDVRYEPELATHHLWREKRLALHAAALGFVHPVTGEALRFNAPPPESFERFLRAARQQRGAASRPPRQGPRRG